MPALGTLRSDVRAQLDGLTAGLEDALGGDLVGVYLHGSLVLGCFNPQRSDVDVLAVTAHRSNEPVRRRIRQLLLAHSGPKAWPRTPPYPLEITLLTEDGLRPWRHPTPFDLHFSESGRGSDLPVRGADHDLAAHVTVLHQAGIVLSGRPVADVFPAVPRADVVDSLLRDLASCREHRWPWYAVLTASRIWATLAAGGLQSKATGAEWALERSPDEFRPLLRRALGIYRGESDDAELDVDAASRYVELVAAEVLAIAAS